MAVNATAVTRENDRRGVLRAVRATSMRTLAALSRSWSRLALTGQLGTEREREIGRQSGARI